MRQDYKKLFRNYFIYLKLFCWIFFLWKSNKLLLNRILQRVITIYGTKIIFFKPGTSWIGSKTTTQKVIHFSTLQPLSRAYYRVKETLKHKITARAQWNNMMNVFICVSIYRGKKSASIYLKMIFLSKNKRAYLTLIYIHKLFTTLYIYIRACWCRVYI